MAKGKDRDGRREARWRRIIQGHARSGLGVREFCRRGKLTETAFYFWRRELLRRDGERHEAEQEQRRPRKLSAGARPVGRAAFVPVTVAQDVGPHTGGRIEIELSGGRRVHVIAPVDRQALADVLAVLEGRPC
jgi:transposase-like protein